MKKNIMRPIICFLVATAFLMPLMGTTALAEDPTVTYEFNAHQSSDPGAIEWTYNPGYMVDGNENTYASTQSDNDVELLIDNECDGTELGTITKVELRVKGYYTGLNDRDITLQPIFISTGEGENYVFDAPAGAGGWSEWIDITEDDNKPLVWNFDEIENLDCRVKAESTMSGSTLYCSMVKIQVTYTT